LICLDDACVDAVALVMSPVTAVVIGAGDRGLIYSRYALDFPDKFKVLFVSVH